MSRTQTSKVYVIIYENNEEYEDYTEWNIGIYSSSIKAEEAKRQVEAKIEVGYYTPTVRIEEYILDEDISI